MSKRILVRTVTDAEAAAIRHLAASRNEPARLVQRATVIAAMLEEPELPVGEAGVRASYKSAGMGPMGGEHFNAAGLKGIDDRPRCGRRSTTRRRCGGRWISLALPTPRSVGDPFAGWMLERLQKAFEQRHSLQLSDATNWTWMDEEGVTGKRQQHWFHEAERRDPEVGEKRGPSFRPMGPHLRVCA